MLGPIIKRSENIKAEMFRSSRKKGTWMVLESTVSRRKCVWNLIWLRSKQRRWRPETQMTDAWEGRKEAGSQREREREQGEARAQARACPQN